MTDIEIRPSEESDFEEIAKLFLPQKRDKEILKWVLRDSDGFYRSYVAMSQSGEILGHIGYVKNLYAYRGQQYEGVFTIEWIVNNWGANRAGLLLYKKVLELGDFTFVIGGTEIVGKIYPLLKFKVPFYVYKYIKVTKPFLYAKALKSPLWKKVLKTAYYSRANLFYENNSTIDDISLIPAFDTSTFNKISSEIVINCEELKVINWIKSAPALDSYIFTIRHNDKSIGRVICYIDKINYPKTGRIVHISYLGENFKIWSAVLLKIEQFLKGKGCCVISTLASSAILINTLKLNGYIIVDKKPFWLRDRNNIFQNAKWHLTYLEGDLAYREVYPCEFH